MAELFKSFLVSLFWKKRGLGDSSQPHEVREPPLNPTEMRISFGNCLRFGKGFAQRSHRFGVRG